MNTVPVYSKSELETRMNDCARQCVLRVLDNDMAGAADWAIEYVKMAQMIQEGKYAPEQARSFPYNRL